MVPGFGVVRKGINVVENGGRLVFQTFDSLVVSFHADSRSTSYMHAQLFIDDNYASLPLLSVFPAKSLFVWDFPAPFK